MYDSSYLGLNCVGRVFPFFICSYCQSTHYDISLIRTEWGLTWVIFLYSSLHILMEKSLFKLSENLESKCSVLFLTC